VRSVHTCSQPQLSLIGLVGSRVLKCVLSALLLGAIEKRDSYAATLLCHVVKSSNVVPLLHAVLERCVSPAFIDRSPSDDGGVVDVSFD